MPHVHITHSLEVYTLSSVYFNIDYTRRICLQHAIFCCVFMPLLLYAPRMTGCMMGSLKAGVQAGVQQGCPEPTF